MLLNGQQRLVFARTQSGCGWNFELHRIKFFEAQTLQSTLVNLCPDGYVERCSYVSGC
jgi:hypothetical protein